MRWCTTCADYKRDKVYGRRHCKFDPGDIYFYSCKYHHVIIYIYIFLLLFPLKVFSQVNVGGLKTKVDDGSIYDVFLCVVFFHFYNTLNRLLPQRPFFLTYTNVEYKCRRENNLVLITRTCLWYYNLQEEFLQE